MNAHDVAIERAKAISAMIGRIRPLVAARPSGRAELEVVKRELMRLAAQRHLFPRSEFPPPAPGDLMWYYVPLWVEPDDTLWLDIQTSNAGAFDGLLHTHGCWSVYAAIEGAAINFIYDSTTSSGSERVSMTFSREDVCSPGQGLVMLQDEFHGVVAQAGGPLRLLRLYERARHARQGYSYDVQHGRLISNNDGRLTL